jgi:hypothetical protein
MMKKYIKQIICCLSVFSLAACSDFFDNEPDNLDTMDQVFQQRQSTLEFLSNVYSYIRPPYRWSNETIWTAISDELDVTYPDYEISKINLGNLAPDKEGLYYGNLWSHYYAGIRAATYFMQHVEECPQLGYVTDKNSPVAIDQRLRLKDEARALRAWFYFCLIRQYGPVVILPDELIGADEETTSMQFPRQSIKFCFDYVAAELEAVIANGYLLNQTTTEKSENYGHVNAPFCKSLKARTLMYAASDFYNRDRTLPLFKDFKNADESYLFDYTDSDRKVRWEAAKKATESVFEYPFALFSVVSEDGKPDPYKSYQNLFQSNDFSNKEIIFAMPARPGKGNDRNFWEMYLACSPRFVKAWSGWGPTQEMVDAYFTKTGYPILKNAGGAFYAEDGSYSEDGFTSASGDNGYTQKNTFKMYANREPRFYISICFNNSKWLADVDQSTVQFFYGGNTGRTEKESRNYSQTGYLCRKFVNPVANLNDGNSQPDNDAIIFRLGEFYLNYAEILNEIDYTANLSQTLHYLNAIRTRAGIPVYGTNKLNGEVPIPATYEAMREAIRRERRVELAFEEARYFDCIRWGIAHLEFDGDKHGMNPNDSRGESVFHQRTALETRKFKEHNLLWPIPLSDIYKGKLLVQNPAWSAIKSIDVD